MKKLFIFLRSMKFGILLMIFVIAFSLIGSLLPQARAADWYTANYVGTAKLILALGLDNIFSSWYFLLLMGLLCANLTLCSVIRLSTVRNAQKNALHAAGEEQIGHAVSASGRDRLCEYLAGKHYRVHKTEEVQIFYKNTLGYYGSFVVHVSILLILVFGALTLYLSETSDHSIVPGGSLALADGTVLAVDDFRMTDETGRLDYASLIHVTAPDGTQTAPREISVNYPFSFRSYKYYQHSYGTAGSITVVNTETGGKDIFSLTEPCFLSIDGRNGVWYEALYQGYVKDDDGHFLPIVTDSGIYTDPIYQVRVASDGTMTSVMALPDETIQVGAVSFTFNKPVNYPGIRIKHTPPLLLALLYIAFILITFGFWLCFLHVPSMVAVRQESFSLHGPKSMGIKLEIDVLLSKIEKGGNTSC